MPTTHYQRLVPPQMPKPPEQPIFPLIFPLLTSSKLTHAVSFFHFTFELENMNSRELQNKNKYYTLEDSTLDL